MYDFTEQCRISFRFLTLGWRFSRSDDEDLKKEDDFEDGEGIDFQNIIVVDNLPLVPKEKFEKLVGVVHKIYSKMGVIKEDGMWMPVDPDTQKTLGYCFIEFNTPQVIFFPLSLIVQLVFISYFWRLVFTVL